MCFKVKTPDPKPVPVLPTREDETKKATRETAARAAKQQGVFGNIFTSALGDSGYGDNAVKVAKLGGERAAA